MGHDTTPLVRLADYRPPTHLVDQVTMTVAFDPTRTRVSTRLALRPNPAAWGRAEALRLDGDEVRLVSIALDDRPLAAADYALEARGLSIPSAPDRPFTVDIETEIDPTANTKLMGLYRSNGVYCTQCEAEGFRRITFYPDRPDVMALFRVRLEADKAEAPLLLCNGNLVENGDLPEGRHYAVWDDPHRKPAYLFAMVAGRLDGLHDRFVTASGREVALAIYVEPGKADRAHYAMDALKRSMRWDETAYGREYDLDVFNIVAVSDFNMGAMENKGLNVFNDKYILASGETATDGDYAGIETVVAHEYFHNWTGNRITCRDWFQLCLKEGLTVFRDQEFTADMRSRAVKRIADVARLRATQFVEDQGPLAHPVRPAAYKEINNFYTTTIYEKGAEVIRALKVLIGDAAFRAGMDLYFARHDGDAATIEQFVACFAEASGRDLGGFMRWYDQAGTPRLAMRRERDGDGLLLHFAQSTPPSPGQAEKGPQVIPIALGLLSASGEPLPLGTNEAPAGVFVLDRETATLRLPSAPHDAIPSILRGFSAPVEASTDLTTEEIGVIARADGDRFKRWEAMQQLALEALVARAGRGDADGAERREAMLESAHAALLDLAEEDPAFVALALVTPGEADVARAIGRDVDPDRVRDARHALKRRIAAAHAPRLRDIHARLRPRGPFSPDSAAAQRRQLCGVALDLLALAGEDGLDLAAETFRDADNMTERMAALSALVQRPGKRRDDALAGFEARHGADPLVMDKWFAIQATIGEAETLARVEALMRHPAFSIANPNRVRALIGAFALSNQSQFHRADGAGYRFLADLLLAIDRSNPQLASRLATAFRTWRMMEPTRRMHADAALTRIARAETLSVDLSDIVERTLAG